MTNNNRFRISRSERENFFRCPYSGYLYSLTPGPQKGSFLSSPSGPVAGVERKGKSSSLLIGGAIHKGWEVLLQGMRRTGQVDEQEAIAAASSHIRQSLIYHDHDGREATEFERFEAITLVEALTVISARYVMTPLLSEYSILDVEKEFAAQPLSQSSVESVGIELPARADAILESREHGSLGILSLKTSKYIERPGDTTKTGRKIMDTQRIDQQGLSEMWIARQSGYPVDFVQFVTLRKGEPRLHDTVEMSKNGETPFYYYSLPLLTGWKSTAGFGGPGDTSYAWAWDYLRIEDGYPKRSSLSWSKWKRFWIWEEGISASDWITRLEQEEIFPPTHQTVNGRSALSELFFISIPVYRTEEEIEEWLAQTEAFDRRTLAGALTVNDLDPDDFSDRLKILQVFPRNRSSCLFPARCQYFEHCHEGTRIHDPYLPADEGFFRPRTDNHPPADPTA